MKLKLIAAVAMLAMGLASCDDSTDSIGSSLTDNMDHLQITTDTFRITSKSIAADSVFSRTTTGYVGCIKDPETNAFITGDFMVQFGTLEGFSFPEKDLIRSLKDGEIIADSCEIGLFYSSFFGDSLATMKVTAHEMNKPMEEGMKYYSNYDPVSNGLIRTNGLKKSKVFTLIDNSIKDSLRNASDYMHSIKIPLNDPYTDKNGKTYSNYGSYLMNKYYEDPDSYKNNYSFIHDVCPGFYIKTEEGIGAMAYITISWLTVHFKMLKDGNVITATTHFAGTEEVMQTTRITNDKEVIAQLTADPTCTYVKSPAGIFTELTLPVDDITRNHLNDTLNTAKVVLTRINNDTHSKYTLKSPTTLLMVERDSIYTFFEKGKNIDNIVSYCTSSTSGNTFTYSNISGLIRHMAEIKEKGLKTNPNWLTEHPNWNKVAIIPVTTTTNSSGSIVKVSHDMTLTSCRLVGGSGNPNDDIKISVIYSKFTNK